MSPPPSPPLAAALDEARTLAAARGWRLPDAATLAEAERLLVLVRRWREPTVQAAPDGAISLEWEAGEHGWLALTVRGAGTLEHGAVIDGDEYGQVEDFGAPLPPWAGELLARLLARGH